MNNMNDKIVELLKSVLSGEVMQYSSFGAAWENSELQTNEGFIALCDRIIKYPDNYRVKPKTKKITTRNWLTIHGKPATWYLDFSITEADVEACRHFKQWLDSSAVVYEVEI